MLSIRLYFLATVGVTVAAISNAMYTRKQFYPATVYLTTSKANVMVLSNLAFAALFVVGTLLKKLFLGSLTGQEQAELESRAKFAVLDTAFALTIFRSELSGQSLAFFTVLLAVKLFHWLAEMRVDFLGPAHGTTVWQHVRLLTLIFLLAAVDFVSVGVVMLLTTGGPSVLLLFGFEFVILLVLIASVMLKYLLTAIDNRMQGRWVNKSVYLFYVDFTADLLRLFLYLMFFLIVCTYYGPPIHLTREVYISFVRVRERLIQFIHFRKLTKDMNTRFADATPEQLVDADPTCIVCREDMESAKVLPCGHMFHFHCLRTWLERSNTCPTCRAPIMVDEQPAEEQQQQEQQQQEQEQQQQQQQQQQPQQQPPQHAEGHPPPAHVHPEGHYIMPQPYAGQGVPGAAPSVFLGYPFGIQAQPPPTVGSFNASMLPQQMMLLQQQTALVQQHISYLHAQLHQANAVLEAHISMQETLQQMADDYSGDAADEAAPPVHHRSEDSEYDDDDDDDESKCAADEAEPTAGQPEPGFATPPRSRVSVEVEASRREDALGDDEDDEDDELGSSWLSPTNASSAAPTAQPVLTRTPSQEEVEQARQARLARFSSGNSDTT